MYKSKLVGNRPSNLLVSIKKVQIYVQLSKNVQKEKSKNLIILKKSDFKLEISKYRTTSNFLSKANFFILVKKFFMTPISNSSIKSSPIKGGVSFPDIQTFLEKIAKKHRARNKLRTGRSGVKEVNVNS